MDNFRTYIYLLTCLTFSMTLGAGLYEIVTVWPNALAAPPASTGMFRGEYGLNSGSFWMIIHPVNLVLWITSLILNWRTPRRKFLLYSLIGYIIIIIVTSIYFVPEIVDIITLEGNILVEDAMLERTQTWAFWNIIRFLFGIIMALILLWGLTIPVFNKE